MCVQCTAHWYVCERAQFGLVIPIKFTDVNSINSYILKRRFCVEMERVREYWMCRLLLKGRMNIIWYIATQWIDVVYIILKVHFNICILCGYMLPFFVVEKFFAYVFPLARKWMNVCSERKVNQKHASAVFQRLVKYEKWKTEEKIRHTLTITTRNRSTHCTKKRKHWKIPNREKKDI